MKKSYEKLDGVVLDIEFIIISVIQGVALTFLGEHAAKVITSWHVEYWLYILSGFLFILLFWSGALIHALSFVDWPIDLGRNFLYFLASFIEILTFSQLDHPFGWFIFTSVFFSLAGVLYLYDLSLIRKREVKFRSTQDKRRLYDHILKRHQFELYVLIPGGLIYSLIATYLIFSYPQLFLDRHFHVVLSAIQAVFSVSLLINSLRTFQRRSVLITNARMKEPLG